MLARRWKNMTPWGNLRGISVFLLLLACGCSPAFITELQVSSYMQKKQHHEVIKALQPKLEKTGETPSFQLYLLAGAFYEIRDYEKMFATVDRLEKNIAMGDDSYYGSDLTVYPKTLRGLAYLDQGDYNRAIKEAEEAYALLNQPKGKSSNFYRSQLIDIAGILGIAYANLNRDRKVERCLAMLESVSPDVSILGPEKYLAIARVNMARKRFNKALAAVKNPAAKVSGMVTAFYDQTFQELPKFFILSKCLYETGAIAEAKSGYDQLLKHPQIKQIGGLYWPVLLDRAKIARAEWEQSLAEQLLKEAAEVIEKQRSSINTETGRIGYVGDKQSIYQEMVSLLVAGGRIAEAFEYVERAKGRALVDLLSSQKNIVTHSREASKVENTLNRLAKVENNLNIIEDQADKGEGRQTRGVVISLKKELAEQAPEFASLVTVTGTSLGEIRERITANETLLEYYSTGKDWYAFVLKREGIAAKKLAAGEIEKDVQRLREALADPSSQGYRELSKMLYDKLVAPIHSLINTKELTVVPHGALHYLPFGALFTGKEYLLDLHNIRVLPNASVLKFLKASLKKDDRQALILGNPDLGDPKYSLKYAEEEALAIAKILPGAQVLLGKDAQAAYVAQHGGRFPIIHFAAHGLFDPENPLNSALLLAKGKDHDGLLKAGDLYRLSLNADLITLSACETALSKVASGDDVMGFTRGFLYAGSRSIVSSLWKVDDLATRDLMVDFYEKVTRMEKDEALRQAQIKVKEKYPHPFFWAAFQLTGLSQ